MVNEEVIIICEAYKASDNAFAMITSESQHNFSAGNLNALRKKAGKRVSPQQQLTLYEASLISYFQPKYNTEYKQSFMERGFSSYDQIYDTQFNYVSEAIGLHKEWRVRIGSHIAQPGFEHSEFFPLETQKQKTSLFQFLYDISTSA